jgi:hypothetical protein
MIVEKNMIQRIFTIFTDEMQTLVGDVPRHLQEEGF